MTGIYKITNNINGKAYIGQSVNIHKRWKREKEDSKNENSHSYNYPLMKAFRKYGIENFEFTIIEECEVSELNKREAYWINFYNTFFEGYNQTLGGDSTARQPKEKIIGIISDLNNTGMSHKEIALKWDISVEMVQGINTGRYWRFDTNYPLQKRKIAKTYYCQACGKEISKGSKLCLDCYELTQKMISKRPEKEILTKDLYECRGNFTEIGRKYGVDGNTIRKWCTKYGLPNKSSDYKEKKVKKKVRAAKIGVIQVDKESGEEINRFDSASDAERSLGLSCHASHIIEVCRGKRKTAYGYKWSFL